MNEVSAADAVEILEGARVLLGLALSDFARRISDLPAGDRDAHGTASVRLSQEMGDFADYLRRANGMLLDPVPKLLASRKDRDAVAALAETAEPLLGIPAKLDHLAMRPFYAGDESELGLPLVAEQYAIAADVVRLALQIQGLRVAPRFAPLCLKALILAAPGTFANPRVPHPLAALGGRPDDT